MRVLLALLLCLLPLRSQDPTFLTLEQKEAFLLKAPVVKEQSSKKGITGTVHATLSQGGVVHDASIQSINESKPRFDGTAGVEINFRDSYLYNVAAYRLGKMLGLGHMIPPSVVRWHSGAIAAWTWWVDDVLMDEAGRLKQNTMGPDKDLYARQTLIMRVFDQLIANTDRNVGNMLYDKNWHLWMIDHTRAFRMHAKPMNPKMLDKCDRQLLKSLKSLEFAAMKKELSTCLNDGEIKAVLQRRDFIVATFEKAGPEKLYDLLP
jgi:hypothetical protein